MGVRRTQSSVAGRRCQAQSLTPPGKGSQVEEDSSDESHCCFCRSGRDGPDGTPKGPNASWGSPGCAIISEGKAQKAGAGGVPPSCLWCQQLWWSPCCYYRIQSHHGGWDFHAPSQEVSWRTHLCSRSILGATSSLSVDIQDPISDRFFHKVWQTTALSNTNIYDQVRICMRAWGPRGERTQTRGDKGRYWGGGGLAGAA